MLLTIKIKKHFQMSMSVLRDHMAAVLMLCASIPRDPIPVRVNLDTLEMDELAKVNGLCKTKERKIFLITFEMFA